MRSSRSPIAIALFVFIVPLRCPCPAAELTAEIVPDTWVATGAEWRFFRGRSEPSGGTLAWTTPGFDDGSWEVGRAGIGYGDGDDATVLSDMEDRYSTVYARKSFEVAAPDPTATLELSIDYDDGFIAFLNGTEIARANADAAGGYPAHDGLASDGHEAGTPEVFEVPGGGALVVAGKNVLSVVGLNDDISSSDLSLHPELRAGGALSPGCPDDWYVAASTVVVAGVAPPGTAEVRVNGDAADHDPSTGAWSARTTMPAGGGTIRVEARDAGGGTLAARTLRAFRARSLGGELQADLTLQSADNPHLVVGDVTVPVGRRLVVEPGCEVLIRPGVTLSIQGEVQALGTASAPIRFTRVPCQTNWGSFTFEGSLGANVFRHCEWSYSDGGPGCLTLTDSDLELDGCILRDMDGEGVHAVGSKTRIRRCLTERTQEALSLDEGDTVVEYCEIRDTVGKSDLIDANRSTDPPARIAFNHIHGTTDDGIDVDGGNLVIEGNVIHDCGDQAMSLVGTGSSTVRWNLCYRNGQGLSVKDSYVCVAEHNTFVYQVEAGVRAIEKTPGKGGGIITLRDSIVWGNGTQLLVEAGGSIDASWCDVQGAPAPPLWIIDADPLFADAAGSDYRLTEGSPCIGAASDGGDLGALPFEGQPRWYARGDSNGDGLLDVADPISTLAFLFQGGAAPPCLEAADANVDAAVDVADPVFLLLFLFAEGPAPAPGEAWCPVLVAP